MKIYHFKTASNPANTTREIEIHPDLFPIIERRCQGLAAHEFVFPQIGGENGIAKWLKKACQELGIQYRRIHGFRHTFISQLQSNGVNFRAVMAMVGHNNFNTTLRYSHVSAHDLKGKINALSFPVNDKGGPSKENPGK